MLTRPYPLTPRVVAAVLALWFLVPWYLIIGKFTHGWTMHLPELALDRLIPVQPIWVVIYGSHLIFFWVPVVVMRQEEQIFRTFLAYVMIWSVGLVCFLMYPTILPRPTTSAIGDGFFGWCLRAVYQADTPRNNLPSLHVAHAFVSAFACYLVNRGVGLASLGWASLIALSTLFTKQHYVLDVISGIALAGVACLVFLRTSPRQSLTEADRRGTWFLLQAMIGMWSLVFVGFGVAYLFR